MDLFVVHAAHIFDSFKSVLYPYSFPSPEKPATIFDELMFAVYYISDTQAIHLNSRADHPSCCQSSLEITSGMKMQVHAAEEWFLRMKRQFCVSEDTSRRHMPRRSNCCLHWSASRRGNICCTTSSSSTKTSFTTHSDPVATKMPGGWGLSRCLMRATRTIQWMRVCWTALTSMPLWVVATP